MNGEPLELPPAVGAPVDGTLAEPPADLALSVDAAKAWRRFAPYALAERTLTASRTPGFAKLCQEWVYCAAFEARIQQIGITTVEADRLLKRLADHKKLLNASLGNFNLRSFGKPAATEKPKPATNPFAKAFGSSQA